MWLALRAEPHGRRMPQNQARLGLLVKEWWLGQGGGGTALPHRGSRRPRGHRPGASPDGGDWHGTGGVYPGPRETGGSAVVQQWPVGTGRWGGREGEKWPIQDLGCSWILDQERGAHRESRSLLSSVYFGGYKGDRWRHGSHNLVDHRDRVFLGATGNSRCTCCFPLAGLLSGLGWGPGRGVAGRLLDGASHLRPLLGLGLNGDPLLSAEGRLQDTEELG